MAHRSVDDTLRIRCTYKRAAAFICSLNVLAALYVMHGLISPRNLQPVHRIPAPRLLRNGTLSTPVMRYTQEEMERIKEAHEARRAVEPIDLMKRVKEIQLENLEDALKDKDTEAAKEKLAEELVRRLKVLRGNNPQAQQGALDEWRRKKIEEARRREDGTRAKDDNDTIKEAEEEVRSSLPNEVSNGKLQGGKLLLKGPEIEDGIIPGRPLPSVCNAEPHTDYDGVAVTWGLTHHQESAADCCQACLNQAKNAKEGQMKCNIWVYCPAEEGCYSPDIYEHKQFECWLKQAEKPTINFKGRYPAEYRQTHPNCPQVVAWAAGLLA